MEIIRIALILIHGASALVAGVGTILALAMDEATRISTFSSRYSGWTDFDQSQLIAGLIALVAVNICLYLTYRVLVDANEDTHNANESPHNDD